MSAVFAERKLFDKQNHPLETLTRIPKGEIPALRDFVVGDLPDLLNYDPKKTTDVERVVTQIEKLLAGIGVNRLNQVAGMRPRVGFGGYPSQERDLVTSDLQMIEAAIVHRGGTPPESLTLQVDRFSDASGLIRGSSYETAVYTNPLQHNRFDLFHFDPRLFSTGDVAKMEYDFLFGHRLIETPGEDVVAKLRFGRSLLQEQGKAGVDKATQLIAEAVETFEPILPLMAAYADFFQTEEFAQFRGFFDTHPTRDLKGASGAFAPTIPEIDNYLRGNKLPPHFNKYVRDNLQYYPRSHQRTLLNAINDTKKGITISKLAEDLGEPPELMEQINALTESTQRFRGHHHRAVKTHVPGAVARKATVKGTGSEEDPGRFLRDRMKMGHQRQNGGNSYV